MGSPLNASLYAHKAIRMELNELEETSAGLDSMEEGQIAQLAEQVNLFHRAVKGHNTGEEEVAWPAIDAGFPHVTMPYTFDHRWDEETFLTLERSLSELQHGSPDASRDDKMRKLKRLFTELNVSITHHANREDAHIIPLLAENFTMPEQGEMAGRMAGYIPREVMPWVVPLMIKSLALDEQADYVEIMRSAMPPEAFRAVASWIKAGILEQQWAELSARVPELATAAG